MNKRLEAVLRDAVECRCRPNLDDIDAQNILHAIDDLRSELATLKAENESLKRDAERWRGYQKRKQDLLDRGFLRSPLRAELDATAQG